jgi:hypothetical protein
MWEHVMSLINEQPMWTTGSLSEAMDDVAKSGQKARSVSKR